MNRDDLNVKCREALATRLRHDDEYGAEHGWSVGDDSLWLSSVSFTTIFDTLFPLIEADIRAEAQREGWCHAHDELCKRGKFCSTHRPWPYPDIARGVTQNGDGNE